MKGKLRMSPYRRAREELLSGRDATRIQAMADLEAAIRADQKRIDSEQPADAFLLPLRPDGTHHYVSTYCLHSDHAACRLTCLCCGQPCQCGCEHPKPEPECPYSYHDEHDEGVDFPCVCEPHAVGGAHGCPEGCPTHNHGGEDVPEGAIGGRATDEELGEEDRCPVCGCAVGPECEACERDCWSGEPLRTYATQVSAIAPGGNAEDCPRCSGTNPPYPFICPGHPAEGALAERSRCPHCHMPHDLDGWPAEICRRMRENGRVDDPTGERR